MNAVIPLKDRVLAAAAANPSLTRRQARRLAAILLALSVAVGLTLFELIGGLAHSRDRPLAVTVKLADGWALATAVLTWLVLGRGEQALARSRTVLATATLAYPLFLMGWLHGFDGGYGASTLAGTAVCFGFTLVAGTTPLASFFALRLGVEPDHPGMLGAAAGAAAAGWAGVLSILSCPLTSVGHTLIAHAAPIALLSAAGAFLGASRLGLRRLVLPVRPAMQIPSALARSYSGPRPS